MSIKSKSLHSYLMFDFLIKQIKLLEFITTSTFPQITNGIWKWKLLLSKVYLFCITTGGRQQRVKTFERYRKDFHTCRRWKKQQCKLPLSKRQTLSRELIGWLWHSDVWRSRWDMVGFQGVGIEIKGWRYVLDFTKLLFAGLHGQVRGLFLFRVRGWTTHCGCSSFHGVSRFEISLGMRSFCKRQGRDIRPIRLVVANVAVRRYFSLLFS